MTRHPSNRERLMDAAGELFYREGLHAITADRVAEHAGLTKPTIYNIFGSKDALVIETLERRAEQIRSYIEQRIAQFDEPLRKLMEVLEVHAEMLTSDGFHGCPLVIAAVQAPDSEAARQLAQKHKTWLQSQLMSLARRAGLRAPETLSWTLLLLLEGAAAMSSSQPPEVVARHARASAKSLISAHK